MRPSFVWPARTSSPSSRLLAAWLHTLFILDLRPRRPDSVAELHASACPMNRSADIDAPHDRQAEPAAGRQAARFKVICDSLVCARSRSERVSNHIVTY